MDTNTILLLAAWAAVMAFVLDFLKILIPKDIEKLKFVQQLRLAGINFVVLAILGYISYYLSIYISTRISGTATELVIRTTIVATFFGAILGSVWIHIIFPAIKNVIFPPRDKSKGGDS